MPDQTSGDRFRYSISNLATTLQVNGEACYFGLRNTEKKRVSALGGAMQLTEAGVAMLRDLFDAQNIEVDHGIPDARFDAPAEFQDAIFSVFAVLAGKRQHPYLLDPLADIKGELAGAEAPTIGKIVGSNDDLDAIDFRFVKFVRQGGGPRVSKRAGDFQSVRFFALWQMLLPKRLEALKGSLAFRLLSDEELDSTQGGACQGKTEDGLVIFDNVFRIP